MFRSVIGCHENSWYTPSALECKGKLWHARTNFWILTGSSPDRADLIDHRRQRNTKFRCIYVYVVPSCFVVLGLCSWWSHNVAASPCHKCVKYTIVKEKCIRELRLLLTASFEKRHMNQTDYTGSLMFWSLPEIIVVPFPYFGLANCWDFLIL